MIKTFLAILSLLLLAPSARAQDFDYYLMALTWTPSFCQSGGTDRAPEQCDPDRDLGFTLHGLWPQYEDGWPEYCTTSARDPSRSETGAMADIMGSGGLAWYQWKKHGRCSGLSSQDYFNTARLAYTLLNRPQIGDDRITADELETAFIEANPDLDPTALVVTCRSNTVQEVRICLDKSLSPRDCGTDVLRSACRSRGDLDLPPIP